MPAAAAEPLADGWTYATAPRAWSWPRDHGAHPETQTEWWYYTGNLSETAPARAGAGEPGAMPREFGFQFTIFRRGLVPPDGARPVRASKLATTDALLLHQALTDVTGGKFFHEETARRPALGMAGAITESLHVWVEQTSSILRPDGKLAVQMRAENFSADLLMEAAKPPMLNGEGGRDAKGPRPEQASWYYSMPRLLTTGTVTAQGGAPVPVAGTAWLDREFGSSQLPDGTVGWDWFAIQLADGSDLMLYQLRDKSGKPTAESGGTWNDARGNVVLLKAADVVIQPTSHWRSPHSGAKYPAAWRLRVPKVGLDVTAAARVADQELTPAAGAAPGAGVTYWEGAVGLRGTLGAKAVQGVGYAELTGYAGSIGGKL